MTYEEALRWTDDSLSQGKVLPEQESYAYMGVVKIALEKQISKSPTMWGDGYCDGELVMESYECPNCGCIYDFDTDGKLDYCHNCGQAIDWSEEK